MKAFMALCVTALAVLFCGCGTAHHPGASRSLPAKPQPQTIPATSIKLPPESARTPEGAKPAVAPKTRSLAPGQKTIDHAGLLLIESFEGYSRCAYWDPYGRVWTAGFGQTHGVYGGFCFASRAAAEENLRRSVVREYEWAIDQLGSKITHNQNAVNGLDSFAYNLGAGIFTGTLRLLLERGDLRGACSIMESYDHAGGVVLEGLRTRRLAECAVIQRTPPRPVSTADLLARRRTLRRVLVADGCVARRDHRQKLGPRCSRWFEEGAKVNKTLHERGVR